MAALTKYLSAHAEPESAVLAADIQPRFARALVIPIYAEAPDCLVGTTAHLPLDQNTLCIAVINVPTDAPPAKVKQTQTLLKDIQPPGAASLVIVDRVSKPINHRQGVGLARKIGTDIALHLYARGQLASPWIYQTDADAQLPANYFNHADRSGKESAGALVFAHHHTHEDPLLQTAATLYENHMSRYIEGLSYAGSQYAYPTLGSTICVHAEAYAQVRGFPKRNAGEDFYLLNKIAKTRGVSYTPQVRIQLSARHSDRVPFGTGPAVAAIAQALETSATGEAAARTYHDQSYELLRVALAQLGEFATWDEPTQMIFANPQTRELLEAIGFMRACPQLQAQYAAGARRQRAVNEWFDGFKTLRFIHEARRFYPDQALCSVLNLETHRRYMQE